MRSAGPEQQAAALLRLFEAPHYFRRAGKGQFKKGPGGDRQGGAAGHRAQAPAGRRSRNGPAELVAGRCPAPVQEQLYKILFKPDKNAPEYKAVVGRQAAQKAPLDLLKAPAPSPAPTSSTGGASCSTAFPRAPASQPGRPGHQGRVAAGAGAGLLDRRFADHRDRRRLSVNGLGTGEIIFGVHIAAPAWPLRPIRPVDKVARERCPPSTCPATS
jgi:exoribonuclease-2